MVKYIFIIWVDGLVVFFYFVMVGEFDEIFVEGKVVMNRFFLVFSIGMIFVVREFFYDEFVDVV